MPSPLIGIHAAIGEIGALAYLWVFIELLNPSIRRIKRARTAAWVGTIFLWISWFLAGYYYVNIYSTGVKQLIKAGPTPWAHSVFTETKEHVFLFLPILSVFALIAIYHHGNDLLQKEKNTKRAILALVGLIVLIAFSMAAMGYLISSGARSALEANL